MKGSRRRKATAARRARAIEAKRQRSESTRARAIEVLGGATSQLGGDELDRALESYSIPAAEADIARRDDVAAFEVQLIAAGLTVTAGANGKKKDYTADALRAAAREGIYSGVRLMANANSDARGHVMNREHKAATAVVGKILGTRWDDESRSIRGIAVVNKSNSNLVANIRNSIGDKPVLELSVDHLIEYRDDQAKMSVLRIVECDSVDFVLGGNAGGKIASALEAETKEGEEMNIKLLIKILKAQVVAGVKGAAELLEKISVDEPSAEDIAAAEQHVDEWLATTTPAAGDGAGAKDGAKDSDSAKDDAKDSDSAQSAAPPDVSAAVQAAVEAALAPMRAAQTEATLRERLASRHVSREFIDAAVESIGGRALEAAAVDEVVDRYAKLYAAANPAARAGVLGAQTGTQNAYERAVEALVSMQPQPQGLRVQDEDGNFSIRRPAFDSLEAAYTQITGQPLTSRGQVFTDLCQLPVNVPFGAEMRDHYRRQGRSFEAITGAEFAVGFGESLNITAVNSFTASHHNVWMDIPGFTETLSINDFIDHEYVVYGGFSDLSTVNTGGTSGATYDQAYSAFSDFTEETGSWAISTRGNIYYIDRAALFNDRVGITTQVPRKMGIAAARTLYTFVLDTLIMNNPNVADGNALFSTSHTNSTLNVSAPLSTPSNLHVLRTRFRKQVEKDSSGLLGLNLNYLLVGPTLEQTAFELVIGTTLPGQNNANVPNINNALGLRYSVIPDMDTWAGTGHYVGLALGQGPIPVQLGFLEGRVEPQIMRADFGETIGDVGGSHYDRFYLKIRHEYGGEVVEWRCFQGGTSAGSW